ncbi:MAG: hypothetical protein A4E55_00351 [Pelotomaculum sp. PtaU1.Bin035]|nr:MAG: hypothetical protein A4E55_00351 [Pelotomaculum sp. PtaU1.Bin035]
MIYLKKALYLSVREDFNNSVEPGYIDRANDELIREAIAYVDTNGFPENVLKVEADALARAATRRGIPLREESVNENLQTSD